MPGSVTSTRSYGRKLQDQRIRHRVLEWENSERNANTNLYFKKLNFTTAQHAAWESDSQKDNLREKEEKEARQRNLNLRREKLAHLLAQEAEQIRNELQEMHHMENQKRLIGGDLDELKVINYEMRKRDEEKRTQDRELKLYHRWRAEQPLLREAEGRQRTENVRRAWMDQIKERKEREEQRTAEEEAEIERKRSMLAQQEALLEAQLEEERIRAAELREILECQVEMLRKREEQAEELSIKEKLMQEYQASIEELAQRRQKAHQQKVKLQLGDYYREHFNLKLKQRSKEIKEAVKEDQRLIAELLARGPDPAAEEAARREERQQLERANAALAFYAEQERRRERELHNLFHEEARLFWERQDKCWREEQEARNQLMADTLECLRLQVQERLMKNKSEQVALLKEREDMLRDLEKQNEEYERTRQFLESKDNYRQSLSSQVEDKKLAQLQELRRQKEEHEERERKMREEEQRLMEEFKKLSMKYPPHPLSFGRSHFIPG